MYPFLFDSSALMSIHSALRLSSNKMAMVAIDTSSLFRRTPGPVRLALSKRRWSLGAVMQ